MRENPALQRARETASRAFGGYLKPELTELAVGRHILRTAGEYLPRVVKRGVAGRGASSLTPPHQAVCYRDMETLSRYPLVTVYIQLL
jgi:hypothetical protein